MTLAVDGGVPVRNTLLPYARQVVDDDDVEAVSKVLRGDWLTTGPAVEEFERAIAERVGAEHAVAFSSGTAALHGAAFAAGLRDGDEAVTTPMTFCSTANAVVFLGATPVFADVEPGSLNIDVAEVERRLSPDTKAIVAVDFAGQPAHLERLSELARSRGLVLIEDACHALGATLEGRPIGSISDLTAFSFHPVKHVAAGEGGITSTNDPELARRLRLFRNHGITTDFRQRAKAGSWEYEMIELGFNYRLTDLQSALATSQLRKLDASLERRRAVAETYDRELADLPVKRFAPRPGVEHAYHLYVVELDLDALRADRGAVFAALRAEGIGVNVHYIPVHYHPYYRERFGTHPGMLPVAEAAYEGLLSLPMFAGMTDADAADVVAAMWKVLTAYRR